MNENSQSLAYDDALWDKIFAETQDVLEHFAKEAHEEYIAGLTEDFDPDTDPVFIANMI